MPDLSPVQDPNPNPHPYPKVQLFVCIIILIAILTFAGYCFLYVKDDIAPWKLTVLGVLLAVASGTVTYFLAGGLNLKGTVNLGLAKFDLEAISAVAVMILVLFVWIYAMKPSEVQKKIDDLRHSEDQSKIDELRHDVEVMKGKIRDASVLGAKGSITDFWLDLPDKYGSGEDDIPQAMSNLYEELAKKTGSDTLTEQAIMIVNAIIAWVDKDPDRVLELIPKEKATLSGVLSNKIRSQPFLLRGLAYDFKKDPTDAIPEYEKASEIDTESQEVLNRLAICRMLTKDHSGALRDVNKAITLGESLPQGKAETQLFFSYVIKSALLVAEPGEEILITTKKATTAGELYNKRLPGPTASRWLGHAYALRSNAMARRERFDEQMNCLQSMLPYWDSVRDRYSPIKQLLLLYKTQYGSGMLPYEPATSVKVLNEAAEIAGPYVRAEIKGIEPDGTKSEVKKSESKIGTNRVIEEFYLTALVTRADALLLLNDTSGARRDIEQAMKGLKLLEAEGPLSVSLDLDAKAQGVYGRYCLAVKDKEMALKALTKSCGLYDLIKDAGLKYATAVENARTVLALASATPRWDAKTVRRLQSEAVRLLKLESSKRSQRLAKSLTALGSSVNSPRKAA